MEVQDQFGREGEQGEQRNSCAVCLGERRRVLKPFWPLEPAPAWLAFACRLKPAPA